MSKIGVLSAAEPELVEDEPVELSPSPAEVEEESAVELVEPVDPGVALADPIPLEKPVELDPPPHAARPASRGSMTGHKRMRRVSLARSRPAVIPGGKAETAHGAHGPSSCPGFIFLPLSRNVVQVRGRIDRKQRRVEPDILVALRDQKSPPWWQGQIWKYERAPVRQMNGMEGHEEIWGFAELLTRPEVPSACISLLWVA
jgi:hypothetical protein